MNVSRKILICASACEDIGLLIPVLHSVGIEPDVILRHGQDARYRAELFDPSRYVGLIILGDGEADADNKEVYGPEILWAQFARNTGTAILGICHGAQLLANLYCGRLHKRTRPKAEN